MTATAVNAEIDTLLRHLGEAADAFVRLEGRYDDGAAGPPATGFDALIALDAGALRLPAPVEGAEVHRALVNALYCADALKDALAMSADIDSARRAHKETS